jgi:hypothetical protein
VEAILAVPSARSLELLGCYLGQIQVVWVRVKVRLAIFGICKAWHWSLEPYSVTGVWRRIELLIDGDEERRATALCILAKSYFEHQNISFGSCNISLEVMKLCMLGLRTEIDGMGVCLSLWECSREVLSGHSAGGV